MDLASSSRRASHLTSQVGRVSYTALVAMRKEEASSRKEAFEKCRFVLGQVERTVSMTRQAAAAVGGLLMPGLWYFWHQLRSGDVAERLVISPVSSGSLDVGYLICRDCCD